MPVFCVDRTDIMHRNKDAAPESNSERRLLRVLYSSVNPDDWTSVAALSQTVSTFTGNEPSATDFQNSPSSDLCQCESDSIVTWKPFSRSVGSICVDGVMYLSSLSATSADVLSPMSVTCQPSTANGTAFTTEEMVEIIGPSTAVTLHLWALVLFVFPALTVFGNMLVVLSVYRERSLRTATNYFIVSLAVADIMVAILVMPLAVYVEVRSMTIRSVSVK